MSILLLGNLDAKATDEEIRAFLVKYGFPEYHSIEHMEGDGTRPAVRLTFDTLDDLSLEKLKGRIHDMFWRGHKLSALVMRERFS
ncbi:RNA-binding protein [Cupriavidus lacunae]|uniref:RNA-binding protein n=1 Tax=Cupriavidus lacunae TaxID=2666307 RepID=A0A370MXP3_9BURK|nr:RNA-binding protein [Cupriavidus lacunae]RDJ98140.1 RNA-binding protein [Cupriavidus lacunae]